MAPGAMMPGMYNPQGMPHLPQLAQPNPMADTGMGYVQMGPQQSFGATNQGPGSQLHHDMCNCFAHTRLGLSMGQHALL